MIDLTINKTGLEHNIQKARENRIVIPTIAQMQHPETIPEQDSRPAQERGTVGREPPEPVPHHLEERGQGVRRPLPGGPQLHRAAPGPHRRALPHRGHGGQVVPHRLPQGGRLLRLPGPPAGHRPVRRRPITRPSGPPPATTAAAAPSTPSCWPADSVAILPAGDEQGAL